LKRPPFLFKKVLETKWTVSGSMAGELERVASPYTERFLSSLMGLISIFLRPIATVARP
jgi:hypothetical protein